MRQGISCRDPPAQGLPVEPHPAQVRLYGRYSFLPAGTAILFLCATPVLGGLPGWQILAAAGIAVVILVPFFMHTLRSHDRLFGTTGQPGKFP